MPERALRDQAARDTIRTGLNKNLMVLAGAGGGKTHELIERMVVCVRRGRAEVDRIAAITFTRKAAGEMRGRFFVRLQEEMGKTGGEEARRVREGMEKADQCFIGTIHSFCGQLLRARPLEAGLSPDFTEIEEREESVLRREAWDRFVQGLYLEDDPRLPKLEGLGLRTEDLYSFYERRCLFSDLALKRVEAGKPDLDRAMQEAVAFLGLVEAQVPDPLPDRRDRMMEALANARSFLEHRPIETDGDRVAFLNLFPSKADVTLKCWAPNTGFARELRDRLYGEFRERVLEPALRSWRQYVYGHVVDLADEAVSRFETERLRASTLTFQDLLVRAAALLRDHPSVRKYFQDRYTCMFVDEFQDTDPIQAEIMFYLAGRDIEEKDWRRLVPCEGSLFLVGDEKQSIYRFRRADVETFRLVRDRIAGTGGEVLHLNTSFRSLGSLCDWINKAFPPLFKEQQERYQAAFGPLFQHRPDGADLHCVRRITVEKIKWNSRAEIASVDSRRIAAFISAAISGQTEFNGEGEGALLAPRASPGDFLILTRTTKCLAIYARALEACGIPYDIVGGGRLGESSELRALVDLLEAIHTPGNPLPLLCYLRGPLVGLGDDEFYAFHLAGGQFHYQHVLPQGLPEELRDRLKEAFDRIERGAKWVRTKTPATAFELILEDLGLPAFAASGSMGSSRAGNLLRVLAMVRQWEDQGMHWGQILAELRDLIDDPGYKAEEMTLESGEKNAVRLMNLHQAKGLQARVVFLAEPYDTSAGGHEPDFHVSRMGEVPFLSMPVSRSKGEYQSEAIAEPAGWDEDSEEEGKFLEAEELRLLYVAATRAGNLLVVSRYEGNLEKGSWSPLYRSLDAVPELPVYEASVTTGAEAGVPDWEGERKEREVRFRVIQRPSYAVGTITGETASHEMPWATGEGRGTDYGIVIHRLFEDAVQDRLPENIEAYIHHLLNERRLDPDLAGEALGALHAFQSSTIWEEIKRSGEVYTEVPFAAAQQMGGLPGVVRGVIDLLYRLPGGWKIVDYKTDAPATEPEARRLIAHYAPQIRAYAGHWEAISGEAVVVKGLWFAGKGIVEGWSEGRAMDIPDT